MDGLIPAAATAWRDCGADPPRSLESAAAAAKKEVGRINPLILPRSFSMGFARI